MKRRWERLWARIQQLRPYRAWQRFGEARGNILSAGIAYYAFFSLFPAIALAAIGFGFVLNGRPDLLEAVGRSLNEVLPGFVKTPEHPTGVFELKAPPIAALSITGAIALVMLLNSGVGWIGSVRDGLRATFGVEGAPGNAVTTKLRDLGVFLALGATVLVSALLSSGAGAAAAWVSERIGLPGRGGLVGVAGLLVGLVIDTVIMVLLLRVLSGVPLPWHDVRQAALIGAVGLTIMKFFGGQLIQLATRSPLFGSLVVVVGLLFWLNLMAKLILLAAAWAAGDIETALAKLEAPSEVGPAQVRGRAVDGIPDFGARAQDRTTLAAGAVLGATAAVLAGAGGRLVRAVFLRR